MSAFTAKLRPLTAAVLASFTIVACSSNDDGSASGINVGDATASVALEDADFFLQLLHAADMDGTSGALDNVGPFSALVSRFTSDFADNTIFLSSGDNYIPGPRFFAAGDGSLAEALGVAGAGRADIALLNAMGVQASAIGNHELDQGTESFASLVSAEVVGDDDEDGRPAGTYAGASFPYLSANLDLTADETLAPLVTADGQDVSAASGQLAGSVTITVDGETIGVVAATTPLLSSITSAGNIGVLPAESSDIDALAAAIQPSIDALMASGVDKIILLGHMQQISIEQELATLLSGVDIIIAGGSNTLLADSSDTLLAGGVAAGSYPLLYTGADGAPVLLVNVDGDYKYLGRLVVGFDADGQVITETLDSGTNGAWAATSENVAQLGGTENPEVTTIVDSLSGVLQKRDGNILGNTSVFLDGRRSEVRTEETNMGNLTADANLWVASMADDTTSIALKNGGGIRAEIGLVVQPPGTVDPDLVEFLAPAANTVTGKEDGDISQFDIEQTLRFNNGLVLVSLTASELKDVLEHAVASTQGGATPGSFPQVAGLHFSFDASMTARDGGDVNGGATVPGERIRSVALVDGDGTVIDTIVEDGAVVGDPDRSFRTTVLNFLADCAGEPGSECGDGYPFNGLAAADYVDLGAVDKADPGNSDFADAGSEQDAIAEYLMEFYTETSFDQAETDPADDVRIQNLAVREDTVLP